MDSKMTGLGRIDSSQTPLESAKANLATGKQTVTDLEAQLVRAQAQRDARLAEIVSTGDASDAEEERKEKEFRILLGEIAAAQKIFKFYLEKKDFVSCLKQMILYKSLSKKIESFKEPPENITSKHKAKLEEIYRNAEILGEAGEALALENGFTEEDLENEPEKLLEIVEDRQRKEKAGEYFQASDAQASAWQGLADNAKKQGPSVTSIETQHEATPEPQVAQAEIATGEGSDIAERLIAGVKIIYNEKEYTLDELPSESNKNRYKFKSEHTAYFLTLDQIKQAVKRGLASFIEDTKTPEIDLSGLSLEERAELAEIEKQLRELGELPE